MRRKRRSTKSSHHQRGSTEQHDLEHHGETNGEAEPENILERGPMRPKEASPQAIGLEGTVSTTASMAKKLKALALALAMPEPIRPRAGRRSGQR